MLLLTITFSQVFLGIGAYMARIAFAAAPQPMPVLIRMSQVIRGFVSSI